MRRALKMAHCVIAEPPGDHVARTPLWRNRGSTCKVLRGTQVFLIVGKGRAQNSVKAPFCTIEGRIASVHPADHHVVPLQLTHEPITWRR